MVSTGSVKQQEQAGENDVQIMVRTYSGIGSNALFDVLERHTADVEKLFRSVEGFVAYTLARTSDGGFSITMCQSKAGIDDSVRKAQDWIAKNAASTGVARPTILDGSTVLHVTR